MLNLKRLLFLITIFSIFAMSARISMDTDTWWHLRVGQWIYENQKIPKIDYFSYTRVGETWNYPGWLIELPMYLIYKMFGPGGLNIWTAFMVTLAFIFIWLACGADEFIKAFVLVFAAVSSGVYWSARPHLVTFLFSALYLYLLEKYRWSENYQKIKYLGWLPPIMVIWANSHGGFIVGFMVLAAYFVDSLIKYGSDKATKKHIITLALIGLGMILAVCINPSGYNMLRYPFNTVQINALKDYIQEWQSPNFRQLTVQPFIWLLLITFSVVGVSGKKVAISDLLLVSGFAYMSLIAARNISLFSLAAPLVITRHSQYLMEQFKAKHKSSQKMLGKEVRYRAGLNWLIVFGLLLLVVIKAMMVYPEPVNRAAFNSFLPISAVSEIKKNYPPGRIFNSYNWGGYLLFNLQEYQVFVDGRTDLYSDEIINQWISVVQAKSGWHDILDQWKVRLIILEKEYPVVNLLAENNWQLFYQDDQSVVYLR